MRREMISRRRAGEWRLGERFARAIDEGDLPVGVDPEALARYVQAIHMGMSVQAASGATRAELMAVVDIALAGWPFRPTGEGEPKKA